MNKNCKCPYCKKPAWISKEKYIIEMSKFLGYPKCCTKEYLKDIAQGKNCFGITRTMAASKISEACKLVGCSKTTLFKIINKMNIETLVGFSRGRIVKEFNSEMIEKIKNFKLIHDEEIRIKRSKFNYFLNKNIDLIAMEISNNYKKTKHFDFFSNNFVKDN